MWMIQEILLPIFGIEGFYMQHAPENIRYPIRNAVWAMFHIRNPDRKCRERLILRMKKVYRECLKNGTVFLTQTIC